MSKLKRIARESIPAALEKALRYRLLNEPLEAESICRDVLEVEPENQQAAINLLLALTDQFDTEFAAALEQARQVLVDLKGDYEQAYYEGIIHERWACAELDRNMPVSFALGWIREAMRCYVRAESLSPPDVPDAVLRFNTCVRLLETHEARMSDVDGDTYDVEAGFGDDVPPR